jgi:predicted transcriptional regulator YdeE
MSANGTQGGGGHQQGGIRVAIVRKPEWKVMGWIHDHANAGEMFRHFPPELWGEMNSVPRRVSGTRGYMFGDPSFTQAGGDRHTIGIEVPTDFDAPLENMFLVTVPASAYAVFYREPGAKDDVFGVANNWQAPGWKPNPSVTVSSYDDNKDQGFFVFIPIAPADPDAAGEVPELPADPRACYAFVKRHARPLGGAE